MNPTTTQNNREPRRLNYNFFALRAFQNVRKYSITLCEPLEIEDFCLQAMPTVSPIKWHLAHTTWFFETFILKPYAEDYTVFHTGFDHIFNSYYKTVGTIHPRPKRGLLSRPTITEVLNYRTYVDQCMQSILPGTA